MTPAEYLPDRSLGTAYLVDVDGTLARRDGRGPFEWDKVGTDKPNLPVVNLVRHLGAIHRIVVMSGRDEVCRDLTADWLDRQDATLKAELFDTHVRHQYNVLGVIDDRLQVCRMWHAMGLPLFRVGDPDADF